MTKNTISLHKHMVEIHLLLEVTGEEHDDGDDDDDENVKRE